MLVCAVFCICQAKLTQKCLLAILLYKLSYRLLLIRPILQLSLFLLLASSLKIHVYCILGEQVSEHRGKFNYINVYYAYDYHKINFPRLA